MRQRLVRGAEGPRPPNRVEIGRLEVRRQKAEGRRQKAESRRQKAMVTAFCFLFSGFYFILRERCSVCGGSFWPGAWQPEILGGGARQVLDRRRVS